MLYWNWVGVHVFHNDSDISVKQNGGQISIEDAMTSRYVDQVGFREVSQSRHLRRNASSLSGSQGPHISIKASNITGK